MAKEMGVQGFLCKRRAALLLLLAFVFLTTTATSAQQLIVPVTDALPPIKAAAGAQTGQEEEEFIKPGRPGVANPAEIQKAGVLQLEFGYDANFRAAEFHTQQTAPLSLRFAAGSRLLLEATLDTVESETDEQGTRMTGIGDARLGIQIVALKDTERHPALAFAYYVKLPTASEEKGLGTGRFDHKFVTLISRKLGSVDMDLNGALLVVGREDASGWITGGQGALSFSGEFENGFGLEGELSGQTKDDTQPKGLYALGALTYKVNRRFRLDSGMRFGLTDDSPRVGVFAGITVGVADLYRRKH
ncbi:MAG TPA: transporter [Pyrinomonadaceae bacterium]